VDFEQLPPAMQADVLLQREAQRELVADVFISFTGSDFGLVEALEAGIIQASPEIAVLHYKKFPDLEGNEIRKTIDAVIHQCVVAVYLISCDWLGREHCTQEFELGTTPQNTKYEHPGPFKNFAIVFGDVDQSDLERLDGWERFSLKLAKFWPESPSPAELQRVCTRIADMVGTLRPARDQKYLDKYGTPPPGPAGATLSPMSQSSEVAHALQRGRPEPMGVTGLYTVSTRGDEVHVQLSRTDRRARKIASVLMSRHKMRPDQAGCWRMTRAQFEGAFMETVTQVAQDG